MSELRDVTRVGAELVDATTGTWLAARNVNGPLVMFVHGFTSHGRYMRQLAEYVAAHAFCVAFYNYNAYRGIDYAAEGLRTLVEPLSPKLDEHGWFIVAHSTGGLIARQFVASA